MPSPAVSATPGNPPDSGRPTFQDIYTELQPRIRRYLRNLIGGEAEDLSQEVFVKVARALPRFRGDCSVSTWVYRIATHAAFDRLRRPARRASAQVALRVGSSAIEEVPDAEQTLARKEMNECIRRYVDALPPSYRSVVLLSEVEGLTNQEIAGALAVSLDTVKIRLHRARARLRKALETGCSLHRDERNELGCEPKSEVYLKLADLRLSGQRTGIPPRETREPATGSASPDESTSNAGEGSRQCGDRGRAEQECGGSGGSSR